MNLLVPLYVLSLGYGMAWVGSIVGALAVFQCLLQFVGGITSDRFGERVVLTVSFAILTASKKSAPFVQVWGAVIGNIPHRLLRITVRRNGKRLQKALQSCPSGGPSAIRAVGLAQKAGQVEALYTWIPVRARRLSAARAAGMRYQPDVNVASLELRLS